MNDLVTQDPSLDQVLIQGDLSSLPPAQRVNYYMRVCSSMGLNPLTKPFAYIKLNGRTVLYALRDCADQLRKLHNVSIEIVDRKISNGLLSVHVRARMPDGRQDEDVGVVAWNDNLQGDAAANTIMKSVTKAKRRVTLSICGLGMLDESELHTIPDVEFVEFSDAGEIITTPAQPPQKRQSSAEGKRNGDATKHAVLLKKLEKAADPIECKAAWDGADKEFMGRIARGWFDTLAEAYVYRMKDFDIEVNVPEYRVEAAA